VNGLRCNGQPTILVSGPIAAAGLAVDANNVYWVTDQRDQGAPVATFWRSGALRTVARTPRLQ
jgi:sugar lactone lactonase YvrE